MRCMQNIPYLHVHVHVVGSDRRENQPRRHTRQLTHLQPVHSSLERLDLRPTVGPVHTYVLGAHDGPAEDGDLLQLLLGHEFVVFPPDRGPDEGDVHPTVVIANKHGCLVLLVEIEQDFAVFYYGIVARQPEEAGAPNMAEEYRKSTPGVQLAARYEVEQLCHCKGNGPNQSQSDRREAVIYGIGVQRAVLCIESQRSALGTD